MMAGRPPHYCGAEGCNVLISTRDPKCEEHRREAWRAKNQRKARGGPASRSRWSKVRADVLRKHPMCQLKLTHFNDVLATEVDHTLPIFAGGAEYDFKNLASTCHRCHVKKSAQDRVKFRNAG
jgi:5-methylcytosine-specific restriction enzyme A